MFFFNFTSEGDKFMKLCIPVWPLLVKTIDLGIDRKPLKTKGLSLTCLTACSSISIGD